VFGDIPKTEFDRICSLQTISGSGALKLAGETIKKTLKIQRVAVSNPTWANHTQMFEDME